VTWLLPKLVGLRNAQQLLIAGERIDAIKAKNIGLVSEIVEDTDLRDFTYALADRLKQSSGRAVMATRHLIRDGYHADLKGHLVKEALSIGEAAESKDGREGTLAFVQKRRPVFGS
jgi:2-(1,2-epoxy-1,2-dihydrophenyl)acetyl-CoA isomerase